MSTVSGIYAGGLSSRTQDLASMRQARFNKMDQNGDQKITKEEMTAARPKRGHGPDVDEIFSKVDTNQDGAIDQAEDQAAFEAMQKAHANGGGRRPQFDPSQMASTLIQKLDSDQDSKLSLDELKTALKGVGETDDSAIEALFKETDTDSSQGISQDELAKILEKYKPQGPDRSNDRGCYNCHGKNNSTDTGDSSGSTTSISFSLSISFSAQA